MATNAAIVPMLWTLLFMPLMGVLCQRSPQGFTGLRPRVIGGVEVLTRCKAPYSWMVALQFESSTGPLTFCSAVMLTDRVLVTSGYCALQISILGENPISAIVGERDLLLRDIGEQRIGVESYRFHPGYNSTTFDNNIALLRLASPATLSSCVKPASKMEIDRLACSDIDHSCMIVGWGPYANTGRAVNSRLPRYASVTVYDELVTSLWSRYGMGVSHPIGSVYAEAINPKAKACYFDWGGVVSCQRNGYYVLRGVIGDHNCNSGTNVPMLVTDMPYFQPWVDRCINEWDRC